MDPFYISPEDEKEISKGIIAERISGLTRSDPAQFFLNAGQPGCGKTELNVLTAESLQDNLLECNADTLRNYHPEADRILGEFEAHYSDITWPYADRWNGQLIAEGIARRFNLLIETTLGNLPKVQETFQEMKKAGYSTHLQLLAIPERWSWMGIHLRFETAKANRGWARFVPDEVHADRFRKLIENLPRVLESPDLDRVTVYTRDLSVGTAAKAALIRMTDDKRQALAAFSARMNKPIDIAENKAYFEVGDQVKELMSKRNAAAAEMMEFEKKVVELTTGR